ncbi:MAG: hypothetical protein M1818_007132 [Claussenomyces sp. TS43310]|nr:MAG: hypothetical protein M1818_007132 [Claussenomyces sp. TS43310]
MANTASVRDLMLFLEARDLSFDHEALETAFDSHHGTTMAAWMKEYLGPETSLTKHELSMYTALQRSGDIATSEVFPSIRDHSDLEVRDAIEQLKRSTIAIGKQTVTLKTQQEAMASLVKLNEQNESTRIANNAKQYSLWNTENPQIADAIQELLQSLSCQVNELENETKAEDTSLNLNTADLLQDDDRLLLSLRKLASGLHTGELKADIDAQQIRDLCARLIKLTVEGLRTRLDRVYLEASHSSDREFGSYDGGKAEIIALEEELESLYTEILPVAQMSVRQQFLQPAQRAIRSRDATGRNRSRISLTYISSCLSFLVDRIETFTKNVKRHQDHRLAILHFIRTVKSEFSHLEAQSSLSTRTGSPQQNVVAKPTPSTPSRPDRRLSSATSPDGDIVSEQAMLRSLGVSLPGSFADDPAVSDRLLVILDDRENKIQGHAQNFQESVETAITASLHDAYLTLQLLRSSVLSETRYNTVRLIDEEIEEAIALMEMEEEELNKGVDCVNMEKLKGRNRAKDSFLERWAR